MLIGVEKRFVFIANSKSASTSIEKALMVHAEIHRGGTPQRKHILLRATLRDYDFLFGREGYGAGGFFKFGVMRDPAEWIQSWYRYRMGNKVAHRLAEGTSFESFWKDWVAQAGRPGKKRLQSNFFTRRNGTLIADYIIPYPDLENHFATIMQGLGIDARLPHQNVSKIRQMDTPPSEALMGEIRDHFAEDYAILARLDQINAQGLKHLHATRPHVAETADGENRP